MADNFEQTLAHVNTNSKPSDLRITDMRFVDIVGAPMHCTLLRIETNQGITGYGEVRDGASKLYAQMLKRFLIGENPCNIDKIFRRIKQFGGMSRQAGGVCGVELALWDIAGKAYGIPLYLYQMAIYYNKDLVKKYNLQYILDDGFVTIDEIKDLKGKLPKGTYALTYGNLPWAFMSLLYGAGGTLENDMDDLTKDVWRKPMEKLKEAYDAGVIAPMDVDGEQAFGSGKAVFAQLGTWAQGNMSNTLGADKIAEANTLQYSADNPVNFFYQCNWMQLKDPHRSAAKSAAAADFVKYVYEHWMDWSEVGSISPAYRDLNNPEYQKLIQASFTNSKKERDYIKTSNYLYGGYATAGWGTYNDIVYGNVGLEEGLKTLDLMAQGQIEIQEES